MQVKYIMFWRDFTMYNELDIWSDSFLYYQYRFSYPFLSFWKFYRFWWALKDFGLDLTGFLLASVSAESKEKRRPGAGFQRVIMAFQ